MRCSFGLGVDFVLYLRTLYGVLCANSLCVEMYRFLLRQSHHLVLSTFEP
jgi:hypothetical protein